MNLRIDSVEVINPKRKSGSSPQPGNLYPYYAGYSSLFAQKIIETVVLPENSVVLDPWNGGGTTTTVASMLGYNSTGFDLNPVMVIVAKSSLIGQNNLKSIQPLCLELIDLSKKSLALPKSDEIDPLKIWFQPSSAGTLRGLEKAIQRVLIPGPYRLLKDRNISSEVSSIAAVFYVALFRVIRKLLVKFRGSNPTWIKTPSCKKNRLRPNDKAIYDAFSVEVQLICEESNSNNEFLDFPSANIPELNVSSSEALPLPDDHIDFVLTSPPYCTRIDYAVKTRPELAVLGFGNDDSFEELRRSLMGNATVSKKNIEASDLWGDECTIFLRRLYHHTSRASKSYYYKNHIQYFDSLYSSLSEIERVLKPSGAAAIVVQTSYYKELLNDLPKIVGEMGESVGLKTSRVNDFVVRQDMSRLNKGTTKYRPNKKNKETVVFLERN